MILTLEVTRRQFERCFVSAKASESLDSVRTALDSPVRSPPTGRDSYPEAVSRLKVLLQQYNDHQLAASSSPSHHLPTMQGYLPDADELKELINHYYSVVQHLQAQVDLLKEALKSLKKKTKALCEENKSLLEQLKDSTVNQLLNQRQDKREEKPSHRKQERGYNDETGLSIDHFPSKILDGQEWFEVMDDSTRTKASTRSVDNQLFLSPKERKFMTKMEDEVDKIRNLHESKAKHLETLLFSARDEIEEHQKQIVKLEEKLRDKEMIQVAEHPHQAVLCFKCGQQEAVLASTHGEALSRAMEQLKRERDDLMETLTNQNSSVSKIRQREIDAYIQVKKSCELAEQAQLEKAEAIIQVQQLKQEVQQQKDRYDKFVSSAKERAVQENETLILEYQKQLESLNNKIQEVKNEHVATANQVERLTREKVSLLSELEQAKAQILAANTDVSKESQETVRELTETQVKHSLAMQEISTLKTNLQTGNRQREQERTRFTAEMDELRRRLQDAEKGWMDSKEECVLLTDRLNNAVRDVKAANTARKNVDRSRENEVTAMKQQLQQREQNMTAFMQESELKHTQARVELELLLQSQLKISDSLKDECRKLAQQLENTSQKSRAELDDAQQERAKTQTELSSLATKCKTLESQVKQKDKNLTRSSKKVSMLERNVQKYVQQVYDLLLKQNSLMKDRQTLSKELEYWRQQTIQSRNQDDVMRDTDTESNVSNADQSQT